MKNKPVRAIFLVLAGIISLSSIELNSAQAIRAASVSADDSSPNTQQKIAQSNLTGVYSCNDGGTYYFRQVGNQLWWYGESGDGGGTWSNIFKGTIQGTQIRGEWIDVPKGSIQSGGIMVIRRVGNKFIATTKTGGFGGSEWIRQ